MVKMVCPKGFRRVGDACKRILRRTTKKKNNGKGKGKILIGSGAVIVLVIIMAAWLIPTFQTFGDWAKPTGTVYEFYADDVSAVESVSIYFYDYPALNLNPTTTSDAQGNYLMGWNAYSEETYLIRSTKSGYYENQFFWTAPKVTSDVDTYPITAIGMKVYATSYTAVIRDLYADTPADLDDVTDADGADHPNVEIGQGGDDANPDRDEIILQLIISNTDLDSVMGSNFYDYIDGRQRGFILTMEVEDSSTTSADYDQLEVVGWQKRSKDSKDWYSKAINPVVYQDDEDGEIILDGKLIVEVTLDISQCTDLQDGATNTNGIDISIGIHDMTTVNDFLWEDDLKPATDEIIGSDETLLTIEIVDSTGSE